MNNLKKRVSLVLAMIAAGSLAAAGLVACGDDTSVTPREEAGADVTSPEAGDSAVDAGPDGDAAPDRIDIQVEAGSLGEFLSANAGATCDRYRECCSTRGNVAFDMAKCLGDFATQGWDQSLTDLSVEGVADGGKIAYDPAAAGECLTAIRNMTCMNTSAAEFKNAWVKCYAAVKGTGTTGPCKSNAECAPTAFCDLNNNAGTCTPLQAANTTCTPLVGECSYRHAGTPQCVDDGTGAYKCSAPLVNGKNCFYDWECASGACSVRDTIPGDPTSTIATCEDTTDFLYGICNSYKPDGG